MKRGKAVAWAAVLAICCLGGGLWWLFGRPGFAPRPIEPVHPISTAEEGLEFRFSSVTIHGVSGGKVAWKIYAKQFDQLKDQPVLRVIGLKHAFVGEKGQQPLTVTADSLEHNTVSGDMTLAGSVTVLGPDLTMRTPFVTWSGIREVLQFPQQFSAQVGEYTLSTTALASYDVKSGQLVCSGPVLLSAGNNTLRAMGITVDTPKGRFVLDGPVAAEFDVSDPDAWAEGRALPPIPRIPEAIERRYQKDRQQQSAAPPAGARSSGKGARP